MHLIFLVRCDRYSLEMYNISRIKIKGSWCIYCCERIRDKSYMPTTWTKCGGGILINLLEGKLKEMETLGNGFVGFFLLFYWVLYYVPQQNHMSNGLLFQFSIILTRLATWIGWSSCWIFSFKVGTNTKTRIMLALMVACCS